VQNIETVSSQSLSTGGDSEAGSYLRLIDFVHHSSPGLRVTTKRRGDGFILFRARLVQKQLHWPMPSNKGTPERVSVVSPEIQDQILVLSVLYVPIRSKAAGGVWDSGFGG